LTQLSSPSTFDIDALLAPVVEDNAGGDAHAYGRGLRSRFAELRNPPRSANPDAPGADGGSGTVDWAAITTLASRSLRDVSKDLRVACHLAEAAMHCWGLAGLRDGLNLLDRLVVTHWDVLAPEFDPADPDTRRAPLENLLDDPEHGPRLPMAVRALPVLQAGGEPISLLVAMGKASGPPLSDLASAVREIPTGEAREASVRLDETIAALRSFQASLAERMGDEAPSFIHLDESLQLLRQWLDTALRDQLDPQSDDEPAQIATGDARETESCFRTPTPERPAPGDNPRPGTRAVLDSSLQLRAEIYDQLLEAAGVLQSMEPHSPIPYLIQRAVELGRLPFPELVTRLVNEESTLEMFSREFGLSGIAAGASTDD
jgi:type VI secretion system protein ImpA